MFEYSLFKENTVVLSIFIGIQVVYFLLIRSRYVKQLKEITYALNVFLTRVQNFLKEASIVKSDKMEKARWKN